MTRAHGHVWFVIIVADTTTCGNDRACTRHARDGVDTGARRYDVTTCVCMCERRTHMRVPITSAHGRQRMGCGARMAFASMTSGARYRRGSSSRRLLDLQLPAAGPDSLTFSTLLYSTCFLNCSGGISRGSLRKHPSTSFASTRTTRCSSCLSCNREQLVYYTCLYKLLRERALHPR